MDGEIMRMGTSYFSAVSQISTAD